MEDMNKAQKLLYPLIVKATNNKANAQIAMEQIQSEMRCADSLLRQAEAALLALEDAFDAVEDKT